MSHISVLLQSALDGLNLTHGDVFVDATLGNGGHTEAAIERGHDIKIIALDQDPDAIERAKERLAKTRNDITYVNDNFRNLDKILDDLHVEHLSKVLFDIGMSSDQLELSGRGFSFQKDEPLLMTFGKGKEDDLTAKEIVNTWDEENIAAILEGYGEERFAKRIAAQIALERKTKEISTTFELALFFFP
ncbi:16S rRNA (cytosine(1402)-N(4))-methyltransferase RsmH, partial [Candidatus Parcubacteria bacterium]|nr:16S rRNA (cytosine(1402)-N(4))-methyltransferase RsmH [Candidatus Parcubacteria bacterium]